MTDTIPTNATPTANADLGAVTMRPTVVKLRELFFDVLSFELQRFTALGDGASFLCWRSKGGSIAWARLDLFAKPTRENPRRLVLRVVRAGDTGRLLPLVTTATTVRSWALLCPPALLTFGPTSRQR